MIIAQSIKTQMHVEEKKYAEVFKKNPSKVTLTFDFCGLLWRRARESAEGCHEDSLKDDICICALESSSKSERSRSALLLERGLRLRSA